MTSRRKVLYTREHIEIAEHDWLICGLLWVALGSLALGPFGLAARVGRILFAFTLAVHTAEALYAAIRAWRVGLDVQGWLLRTIVTGALALLTLESHLKKRPGLKLVKR